MTSRRSALALLALVLSVGIPVTAAQSATVTTSGPVVVQTREDSSNRTLAILALVVGGIGSVSGLWGAYLGYQSRQDRRTREEARSETLVRIDFVHSTTFEGTFALGTERGAIEEMLYALTVVIRNGGESPEYVTAVFLEEPEMQNGRQGLRIFGGETAGEFYELAPRSAQHVTTVLPADEESSEWMRDGFVAEVWLGSGKHVTSDPTELVDELLTDVQRSRQ